MVSGKDCIELSLKTMYYLCSRCVMPVKGFYWKPYDHNNLIQGSYNDIERQWQNPFSSSFAMSSVLHPIYGQ